MTRQGFLWSVAALLGIVLAAAIAWSASLLAGQHIGLSSVPLSAVSRLAPAPSRTPAHPRSRGVPHRRTATLPGTAVAIPQPSGPATAPAGTPAPAASSPAPAPAASGAASAPSTSPSASAATTPAPPRPAPREDSGRSAGGGSGGAGTGSSDKRDD